MTREEAIKLIEHISITFVPTDQYGDYDDPQPYEEALDMAIEALQQVTGKLRNPDDSLLTEDTEDSKKQKSKLDLISRQDALEYFMTNTNWHDEDGYPIEDWNDKRKLLEDYFNGIPSADLKKMVGCTGCEHYDQQQTAMICRECRRYYKDKHSDFERREP